MNQRKLRSVAQYYYNQAIDEQCRLKDQWYDDHHAGAIEQLDQLKARITMLGDIINGLAIIIWLNGVDNTSPASEKLSSQMRITLAEKLAQQFMEMRTRDSDDARAIEAAWKYIWNYHQQSLSIMNQIASAEFVLDQE